MVARSTGLINRPWKTAWCISTSSSAGRCLSTSKSGSPLLAAPPRRLDPCPCGSGKRYRDCHGSLAPPAPPHPDFDAATALNAAGRHGEALALLDAALARSHDNEMQNLRGLVRVHLMDLE